MEHPPKNYEGPVKYLHPSYLLLGGSDNLQQLDGYDATPQHPSKGYLAGRSTARELRCLRRLHDIRHNAG